MCIRDIPNCTSAPVAMALAPLRQFGIAAVQLTSLQAVSGGGYPGVPSLDILDNVIPFINGEEPKLEAEPRKVLGALDGERIAAAADFIDARRADFHRAFKKPAEAPQLVDRLVWELRQMAQGVADRGAATTQADCALTLLPDDLLPRRGDSFDLRPAAGERLPTATWSGIYDGRVSVDASGTSSPLRMLMRRDGSGVADRASRSRACRPFASRPR